MQRVVHELDAGWLWRYNSFKDASLWMALQTPDKRVGTRKNPKP
jgi:hypothetical protein